MFLPIDSCCFMTYLAINQNENKMPKEKKKALTKTQKDNRSRQLDEENDAWHKSRGKEGKPAVRNGK